MIDIRSKGDKKEQKKMSLVSKIFSSQFRNGPKEDIALKSERRASTETRRTSISTRRSSISSRRSSISSRRSSTFSRSPMRSSLLSDRSSFSEGLRSVTFDLSEFDMGPDKQTEADYDTVLLKSEKVKKGGREEIVFENINGDQVATLSHDPDKSRRNLWGANGELHAIILHQKHKGKNRFKIYGPDRLYEDQWRSANSGYYHWADIKNSDGFDVKFSMTLRDELKTTYSTETFKAGTRREFCVTHGSEPCARITHLGDSRRIAFGRKVDKYLICCFTAIIKEMVEKRML